jgi:hypothetical protein
MAASKAPTVGDRVVIDGIEYVVNRVTVQTKKATTDAGSKAARGLDSGSQATTPTRAQIDLIPVAEAERRVANLQNLLDGVGYDDGEG